MWKWINILINFDIDIVFLRLHPRSRGFWTVCRKTGFGLICVLIVQLSTELVWSSQKPCRVQTLSQHVFIQLPVLWQGLWHKQSISNPQEQKSQMNVNCFTKPLQGMAPTECLLSACLLDMLDCLLTCLLGCLPACLPVCLLACLPACLSSLLSSLLP